jgi:sensor c-di-GMP phosphodiesterase-like protein
MSKVGTVLLGAVIAAAIAAILVMHRQGEQSLREKEALLQQQNEQLTQLAAENERLSNAVAHSQNAGGGDQSELLKLRGEVSMLRRQTNELGRLREENRRLAEAASARPPPAQAEDPAREQQRQFAIAKMNDAKVLLLGLHMFAADNQNQLPSSFDDAKRYFEGANPGLTQTNQFEMVYHGSLQALTNPATIILVRESQPFSFNGRWAKTYGFADGHSEVHMEPSGNFDAWEAQHMAPAPAAGQ